MSSTQDTFWLAYVKDNTPVFGQITLGEYHSKFMRKIVDVDLIMGESVNIYNVGDRTAVQDNKVIHQDKKTAIEYIKHQFTDTIQEYEAKTGNIVDERRAALAIMTGLHKRVLRLGLDK